MQNMYAKAACCKRTFEWEWTWKIIQLSTWHIYMQYAKYAVMSTLND